jgi:hypothetical protein
MIFFSENIAFSRQDKALTPNAFSNVRVLSWVSENQLVDRDVGQP